MTLVQVIEALLFSAQKPLTVRELADALKGAGESDELLPNEFARVKEAEVAAGLEQLKIEYTQSPRGFQLAEKAEGWQLVSHVLSLADRTPHPRSSCGIPALHKQFA